MWVMKVMSKVGKVEWVRRVRGESHRYRVFNYGRE